jgi:hypothetical protein
MVDQNNRVTKINAEQYHMLLAMYETPAANTVATAQFNKQQAAVDRRIVLWYYVQCSQGNEQRSPTFVMSTFVHCFSVEPLSHFTSIHLPANSTNQCCANDGFYPDRLRKD